MEIIQTLGMCLSTTEEVIDFVYDNFQDNINNENGTYFASRALLTTKNETVENINKKMLAKIISEEEIEFVSSDSDDEENGSTIQIEHLNTLNPAGLPPHQLHLKKCTNNAFEKHRFETGSLQWCSIQRCECNVTCNYCKEIR